MEIDMVYWLPLFAVLVGCLYLVVNTNLFYSALALMMILLMVASLFVLLGAEFVAVSQIVVYVGGVLVILVFGILLTNRVDGSKLVYNTYRILPALMACIAVGYILFEMVIGFQKLNVPHSNTEKNEIAQIGVSFLTTHLLAFELIGLLLLVALIGAASIIKEQKS